MGLGDGEKMQPLDLTKPQRGPVVGVSGRGAEMPRPIPNRLRGRGALRSKKLFMNGLIGGTVGGLIGGLLFDPINRMFSGDSAALSRAIGFMVIGLVTGLMVGIVELIARDAWLKMLAGPLAGKEFVL